MDFEAKPFAATCDILDPDERNWCYKPPLYKVHLVPVVDDRKKRRSRQSIPVQRTEVKSMSQFRNVLNEIVKKVILDLRFQNDALKLFIFQKERPSEIDFDSVPFQKLILITQSLELSDVEVEKSEMNLLAPRDRGTRRLLCMTRAVQLLALRLFALFEQYEEVKLSLKSAWSLQHAILRFRNARMLRFFRSTVAFMESEKSKRAGPLTEFVKKWMKSATSEAACLDMVTKKEKSNLQLWQLCTRKYCGFIESLDRPPAEHYIHLANKIRLYEIAKMNLLSTMDSVVPHLDIIRFQSLVFKQKEEAAAECRRYYKKKRQTERTNKK